MEVRKNGGQVGDKKGAETDKISSGNTAELQDVSSFKNPKYPQKYPHSENILVDVKTACWTMCSAGCFC